MNDEEEETGKEDKIKEKAASVVLDEDDVAFLNGKDYVDIEDHKPFLNEKDHVDIEGHKPFLNEKDHVDIKGHKLTGVVEPRETSTDHFVNENITSPVT